MQTLTTLVCLFHHEDQAKPAFEDLLKAGVPQSSITVIGGDGATADGLDKSELASLGMPDGDYDHLKKGIRDGGVVVSVSATEAHVSATESVFARHSAAKIDDVEKTYGAEPARAYDTSEEDVIPILQEDLVVGKRTVDIGGVRLYSRIIEIPVEQSVVLREEHVNINRVAVDRPLSGLEGAFQPKTIELTETAEEVVLSKDARVVEEILVSKASVDHTETVTSTVRHTEVEVEDLAADVALPSTSTGPRGTL